VYYIRLGGWERRLHSALASFLDHSGIDLELIRYINLEASE
jgi:hypothetical protein